MRTSKRSCRASQGKTDGRTDVWWVIRADLRFIQASLRLKWANLRIKWAKVRFKWADLRLL